MKDFLDHIFELCKSLSNSNKYIEISLGKHVCEFIFENSQSAKCIAHIVEALKKLDDSGEDDKYIVDFKEIKNKCYHQHDLQVLINEKGTMRAFVESNLTSKTYTYDANMDMCLSLQYKSPREIEIFKATKHFVDEYKKNILSFNIKHYFYVNLIEVQRPSSTAFYVSLLILRRPNSRQIFSKHFLKVLDILNGCIKSSNKSTQSIYSSICNI